MNPILKVVLTSIFGASGPIAAWLISKGIPPEQAGPLVDALQPILAIATPAAATWFLGMLNTIEARIRGIKTMPAAAANAAVANLPPEAMTAIKVATIPDKAIVTAAGAMPGVEVKVDTSASAGAQAAAADPGVPGVNPA